MYYVIIEKISEHSNYLVNQGILTIHLKIITLS